MILDLHVRFNFQVDANDTQKPQKYDKQKEEINIACLSLAVCKDCLDICMELNCHMSVLRL